MSSRCARTAATRWCSASAGSAATLGLRKEDGAWVVTHEHESVPFDMDGSFRASIGLQP